MTNESDKRRAEKSQKANETEGRNPDPESFDFEVWKKEAFGDEIPKAVSEFLKYRHRDREQ